MKIKTAVVPVAGWGTRLLPVSVAVAKEFLPLGRKPAIQHICEQLANAGIRKIVFVTSARKGNVTDLFAPNEKLIACLTDSKAGIREQFWSQGPFRDIEFECVQQHQQKGLGHAILCARDTIKEEQFVVALGDCPVGLPDQSEIVTRLIQQIDAEQAEIAISFEKIPAQWTRKYGIAKPGRMHDDSFEIEGLVEKPDAESAPSNFAICGRYVLPMSIFELLENQPVGRGGEIQLTDAIERMIQSGSKAIGVLLQDGESRYDVGGMESYVQSFVEFALADPSLRPSVEAAIEKQRRLTS